MNKFTFLFRLGDHTVAGVIKARRFTDCLIGDEKIKGIDYGFFSGKHIKWIPERELIERQINRKTSPGERMSTRIIIILWLLAAAMADDPPLIYIDPPPAIIHTK